MSAVASMTGFADASISLAEGTLSAEIRAVNSRFLELSLRLPDELRQLEPAVRERIQAALGRGKVDCRIGFQRHADAAPARLNRTILDQLQALAGEVQSAVPSARALSTADILRWPGLIESDTLDTELMRAPLSQVLDHALASLLAARQREGKALCGALLERCDAMGAVVQRLRAQLPAIQAELERRMRERLQAAFEPHTGSIGAADLQERIRQELGMHGLRTDIAEEMDRLVTHVTEVRRILAAGGAVGRRLDFLMQELNREANTVGSKASGIDITNAAVELKLLIEQMREQVQNLE